MNKSKSKLSLSLDADLVEELETSGKNISAQVNEALRSEITRRKRHRLLGSMLDELETTHGAVDEKLVDKYLDLLV